MKWRRRLSTIFYHFSNLCQFYEILSYLKFINDSYYGEQQYLHEIKQSELELNE